VKAADILIIGSGSLAAGVINALSQETSCSLRVAIVGRSPAKVSRLALVANARAAILGASVSFVPLPIARFTALAFSRAIRALRPKVIFQVASIQSPWESSHAQNGWTRLLASAGFGITLPLQMVLAAEVSRAAADSEAAIVNASYPDCVNVALHHLGLRVTCGVGNAAIVEAFCRARTKPAATADVRVVGHHGHFYGWLYGKRSRTQPRIWVQGKEVRSVAWHPHLGSVSDELNHVTAATVVPVLMSLLTGELLHTSVPGVAGLPGGYPFTLNHGKFSLRLPSGVTLAEASAHNKTGERLDNLDLASGVQYLGKARQSLASVGYEYAAGFDLADWQAASRKMIALRSRLRHSSS
jgi:hypothetical protein